MDWNMKPLVISLVLMISSACAAAHLTPAGHQIMVVGTAPDDSRCTNLGPISGQGGGTLCGLSISNDRLLDYAYNDLQNKAAAMHATHVHASPPPLGSYDGTTSTATITGIAYRCDKADKRQASRQPTAPY